MTIQHSNNIEDLITTANFIAFLIVTGNTAANNMQPSMLTSIVANKIHSDLSKTFLGQPVSDADHKHINGILKANSYTRK
jgi:hypothetical protein